MDYMFGAPASGTPERSARREFELLLLLLGGSRKGAVQPQEFEKVCDFRSSGAEKHDRRGQSCAHLVGQEFG